VTGRVERIVYHEGLFLNASLDKASDDNERNSLVIGTPEGNRVALVQVAGLIARRIVRFVNEGQALGAGQRVGMIRFGSRADVYLPAGTVSLVGEGQTAIAGETVLAELLGHQLGASYQVS
jgi:phosphatidylserine decarboxylase